MYKDVSPHVCGEICHHMTVHMWGGGMYPHMPRDRHMCMHVDMYSYVPGECTCMETGILMYMEAYMFYVGYVLCVQGSKHNI